jgi:hypothetical protein
MNLIFAFLHNLVTKKYNIAISSRSVNQQVIKERNKSLKGKFKIFNFQILRKKTLKFFKIHFDNML